MTTWTWYAAGLLTALVLFVSLISIYALIVSNTTTSQEREKHEHDQ